MSYILDALKKADSERHLGELPGLHTQPQPGRTAPHQATLWQRRALWIVLAGLVLAIAALAWQMNSPVSAPVQLVAARPMPAAPPLAASVANELPLPPPLPKLAPRPEPVARPVAVARVAVPEPARKPPDTKPVDTAPQSSVIAMADLPDNVRRELPPLAVGGSMYSDNPADRMLLLDKRLVHEGDEIAPGLVLENLKPKAATLRFKGYRFRISY
ncbi:general secretion pathway protein B [Actimicrobium sp. GrIS 1.19]|uniref:general secretion pathway protein GspB n=1 Tax=Actimicrobium sp. GrIS 1.19 TaxID=3071708 RepID=UPI002E0B2924|nr:general secretion pathway protein B [Actimicrobium sp. GrIS 1.19]